MDATSKPSNAFNPIVMAIIKICITLIGDFAMMSRGSFKSIVPAFAAEYPSPAILPLLICARSLHPLFVYGVCGRLTDGLKISSGRLIELRRPFVGGLE